MSEELPIRTEPGGISTERLLRAEVAALRAALRDALRYVDDYIDDARSNAAKDSKYAEHLAHCVADRARYAAAAAPTEDE